MRTDFNKKIYLCLAMLLFLNACSSKPKEFEFENLTQEVVKIKKEGGYYKVGSPYTILGQSYSPKEDYDYKETGIASWYGEAFHNKLTANGETYNMGDITAAHRTLPMPSVVRITNLENGKSIVARVNDRGPYAKNRIIDVSKEGAEMLGYTQKGTAKVKVEILEEESKAIKEAMLSKTNTYAKAKQDVKKNNEKSVDLIKTEDEPVLILQEATKDVVIVDDVAEIKPLVKDVSKPYYIQVGAFSDYQKAKDMSNNVARFGMVSIEESYLSANGVYRVRLGGYKTRDEANKILDSLLDYGHSDVTIVKEQER